MRSKFNGGEIAGLIKSRDQVLGGFLDTLDGFASTLAFEFNKVFSSGQGLTGYSSITSVNGVTSATAELDEAGLSATPSTGHLMYSWIYTPNKTDPNDNNPS